MAKYKVFEVKNDYKTYFVIAKPFLFFFITDVYGYHPFGFEDFEEYRYDTQQEAQKDADELNTKKTKKYKLV